MTPLWLQVMIGVAVPLGVVLITVYGRNITKTQNAIHVLVNSRLTAALDEIKQLRTFLTPEQKFNSEERVDIPPP